MPNKILFAIPRNDLGQNDNSLAAKSAAIEARLRVQSRGLDAINPAWIVDRTGIAQILGVQPRTIEHWVREEKVPVFKLSARCQRFRVADVIRALQKFEIKEAGYRPEHRTK
jgi:hypothetical protein